jgi:Uma2 family endonuclease
MDIEIALDREELLRRWQELADDPDSPDRYELNELGELILAPKPTNKHQRAAFAVARGLEAQLGPEAATEIAVFTDRGIRVPDVVWMPAARWKGREDESPLSFVPDVCVEVLSPGNSRAEIRMKIGAYLRGGAREVVVAGRKGEVEYFGPEGKREASALGLKLELPAELF